MFPLLTRLPKTVLLRGHHRLCTVPPASTEHASDFHQEIIKVKESMQRALDGTNYIEESAVQAYLETDAAARQPRGEYLLRYQMFAQEDIEKALAQYDDLEAKVGQERLHSAEKTTGLGSLLAKTLAMKFRLFRDMENVSRSMHGGIGQ